MANTWAVSDLHGNLNLWHQIQKFCAEDDVIYVLGDSTDRGPEPWRTFVEVYSDPRVKYIRGNHEDMLVQAIREYFRHPNTYYAYPEFIRLCNNGGIDTFDQWEKEKSRSVWFRALANLPYKEVFINKDDYIITMTHSGYTEDKWSGYCDQQDMLWDRHHFYSSIDSRRTDYVVHGHTPIPLLIKALKEREYFYEDSEDFDEKLRFKTPEYVGNGAYWYAEGTKCCLDCATVKTGCTVLLNLDTFEQKVFVEEK